MSDSAAKKILLDNVHERSRNTLFRTGGGLFRFKPTVEKWTASSGGSKNFEKGGGWKTICQPRPHLSQIHNDLYAFYTEKTGFLEKKNSEPIGAAAPTAPLNPPLTGPEDSGWHGQGRRHMVDMSTPRLPEVVTEINANPMSFTGQ